VKEIKQPLHNTNSYLDTIYPGEKDTLIRGLCFSPNDSFLYVSCGYNIYQYEYNVLDSNQAWYHVKHGMDTSFIQFAEYGQLQLAPDGRIYIGKRGGTTNSNSVINEPNLKGAACNFCRKCLRMDTTQWYTHSLANIPNFNMPPKTPCWPLNNEQLIMNNEQWALYPNPVNTILYIHNANGKKKKLYNTYGQLLISTTKEEIDISGLAKGLYFLNCEEQTQKVLVE
jgi:hypothetical protein